MDEPTQERLKSALWFSLGKLVDEESLALNVNATPQFIGALTEMVWAQIEGVSQDLETFAKYPSFPLYSPPSPLPLQRRSATDQLLQRHANRTTITTDDVLLLARRNEGLAAVLREYVDALPSSAAAATATSAAGTGTGRGNKGKGRAR
ncbi:MAG: hypothetical protein M1832_003633 [Thelocarpon impressellum]|nr:MAG: hypothetical protein M1832_003633 [Thelocarpon impressellum]